jgi:hypothetical protein
MSIELHTCLPYLQQHMFTLFTTTHAYLIYNNTCLPYLQQHMLTLFTTTHVYLIYNNTCLLYLQQHIFTLFTTTLSKPLKLGVDIYLHVESTYTIASYQKE